MDQRYSPRKVHKHHGAVCGGTTANVLLAGRGANQGIHPAATAAWTEAMISQMQAGTETWAVNELVRLVYNGLADCLNHAEKNGYRFINCLGGSGDSHCFDPAPEQDRDIVLRRYVREQKPREIAAALGLILTLVGKKK